MTAKNINYQKIIELRIAHLKDKEREVISSRFGLATDKKTLAAIGRKLNLSRERVRQIEREALRKLSKEILEESPTEVGEVAKHFEKSGGVISKSEAIKQLLSPDANENEKNALQLFIALIPEIEEIIRDEELHDSWIMKSMPKELVVKILNQWVKYLRTKKQPEKIDVIIEAHPDHKKHKISFLSGLPKVSRKILETYEGTLGLTEWPLYNPKNIRDKIYYVLKKNQKPMHFTEIARAIKTEEFDQKKVVTATVHNELISDPRFVLVGRGIYALSEWGYKEGTVKEIIFSILSKNSSMDFPSIYENVSKERVVRKNTVLINLQTGREFKRVGKDIYALK